MHQENIKTWQHDHVFDQNLKRPGESRTMIVVIVTAIMMAVEILFGITSGSMALLADGLHMASHACALGINLFAYRYARRHASDERFNFGTGKVNALGGFSGAILLAGFAMIMVWESMARIISPVQIVYGQAVVVAIIGLIVNGACFLILQRGHQAHHPDHGHHHDHNLRSAYLHVLADALTSLLAIFALLAAKYLSLIWMDPLMGMIGAVLIFRWSLGLLRTTSHVLLDRQGPEKLRKRIQDAVESDGDSRVTDLHLWAIGPNAYSAIISVVAHNPKQPEDYKKRIPNNLGLVHVNIEIFRCGEDPVLDIR